MGAKKELKLKAKIENAEAIRKMVEKIAKFVKNDSATDYFFESGEGQNNFELRLRKMEGGRVITVKVLSSKGILQENEEYTFSIGSPEDFIGFLEKIKFSPYCRITKESSVYAYGSIEIELARINELGNFLELKMHKLREFKDEDRQRLLSLANELGVKEKFIDSRYYSAIFKEKERTG